MARQFGFFTCQPIALKQFNSLTTIVTFSWRGGPEVTHPPWVQDVPGSIPSSGKYFVFALFCFCVLLLFWFYVLSKTHYLSRTFIIEFCNIYLFIILRILQILWPIIKVSRYIPIICNCQIIKLFSFYLCWAHLFINVKMYSKK